MPQTIFRTPSFAPAPRPDISVAIYLGINT
jgi:hypothetical protein